MKKIIIENQDFEVYTFPLERKQYYWIFFFKKIEKFVVSELEKVHPFFDGHCSFNINLEIKKFSLTIWVIVMDSMLLLDYQSRQKNKSLYIIKSYFPKQRKKRVFTRHSQFFLKYGPMATLTFILVVLLVSSFVSDNKINPVDVQNTISIKPVNENNSLNDNIKLFLESLVNTESEYFCTSINYSSNKSPYILTEVNMTLTMQLYGFFPEQIVELLPAKRGNDEGILQLSNITFDKNVPAISVHVLEARDTSSVIPTNIPSARSSKAIRDLVLAEKGSISEENWSDQVLSFSVPVRTWKSFYMALFDILIVENKTFEELNIVCEKNSPLVTVRFRVSHGNIPSELLLLANILKYQEEYHSKNQTVDVKPAVKNTSEHNKNIGTVKKLDGSNVRFYINDEGKIIYIYE